MINLIGSPVVGAYATNRMSKVVSPSVTVVYSTLSPVIFLAAFVLSGEIGIKLTSGVPSIYLFQCPSGRSRQILSRNALKFLPK